MTIHSEALRALLEEAGVCMWTDEHWRPKNQDIDVASIDDGTIINFVRLLIDYISDEISPRALERIKARLLVDYETLPVDIDAETFNFVARAAHERDVTLNEFLTEKLKDQLGLDDV